MENITYVNIYNIYFKNDMRADVSLEIYSFNFTVIDNVRVWKSYECHIPNKRIACSRAHHFSYMRKVENRLI